MSGVFVIGFPIAIRQKLEAGAKREAIQVTGVPAGLGKEGKWRLLPDPSEAIHKLRAYCDECSNYEDAFVIVLPYAPVPDDLDRELEALSSLEAEVVYVSAGDDGWPMPAKRQRPDDAFFQSVCRRLLKEIIGDDDENPSSYFRAAAEDTPNLIVAKNALHTCDQVAPHREDFLRKGADALAEMAERNGQVGPVEEFFRGHGLDHAQSGGISTTLEVVKDGKTIHKKTANTHLKQGDKTTPQAAARIYYQDFVLEGQCYVAVLYAGIHPDADVAWVWVLS